MMQIMDVLRWHFADRKILLSVSGGVDSQLLLFLLLQILDERQIELVYFDHGLRSNTNVDVNVIRQLLWGKALELRVVHVDLESRLAYRSRRAMTDFWTVGEGMSKDRGFQALAANFRHSYLRDLAEKLNCDMVVTAHHFDDMCETLLAKFSKKTSILGLHPWSFMTEFDGVVFCKPFLSLQKEHIYDLASRYGVGFALDASNLRIDYERNRIRHLWRADCDMLLECLLSDAYSNQERLLNLPANLIQDIGCGFLAFDNSDWSQWDLIEKLYVFRNLFGRLSEDVFREFEQFIENAKSASMFQYNGVRVFKTINSCFATNLDDSQLRLRMFGLDNDVEFAQAHMRFCLDSRSLTYKKFFRKMNIPVFLRPLTPVCISECAGSIEPHYKLYSKSLILSVYKNFVRLA